MFNLFKKKEKKEEDNQLNYIENIYEVNEAIKKEKKEKLLKHEKRKRKNIIALKDLNVFDEEFYRQIKNFVKADLGYIDLNKAEKVQSIDITDIEEVIDFSFLSYFINVSSLYFENCKVKSLEPIGKLEKLELLDLTNYKSSSEFDFEKLNSLENPIELNLSDFEEVNFLDFKGCEKIGNLAINETEKINLVGINEIKGISYLEIDGIDLEQVKLFSNGDFTKLNLMLKENVDANEAYKEISKMKKLEFLEINNCSLDNLDFLSDLALITEICFYKAKINQWDNLLKCSNIKTIQLNNIIITEEILNIISKMENLEDISIINSDIESLELLKDSKSLKNINLWGPKKKNKNFKKQLGNLKNIVTFDL